MDSTGATLVKPQPIAAATPPRDVALRDTAGEAPDCASWPRSAAYVNLKNAGHLVDEAHAHVERLASERTGPDLYRQVYYMSFADSAGVPVEVVTVSDASHSECSMSGVQVYVISRVIGDEPDRK
jgi:hypothetical protein